jgi:hypothetical protein
MRERLRGMTATQAWALLGVSGILWIMLCALGLLWAAVALAIVVTAGVAWVD